MKKREEFSESKTKTPLSKKKKERGEEFPESKKERLFSLKKRRIEK